MTRKSTIVIAASLAALLLVGSGCEKSDIQDVMEIFGGSQGIGLVDVGEHAAGMSTGDKDKDALLDTADTLGNVKKAGELEGEANEALGKKPADYATAKQKLEDALALRPLDWSLREQLNALLAEQGKASEIKPPLLLTQLCKVHDLDNPSPREQRCFKSVIRDRVAVLDASIARQKAAGGLVKCTTYDEMQAAFDQFVRFTPAEMIMKYHFSEDEYARLSDRAEHARSMSLHPGQTCGVVGAPPPS